jgi:hypothetical protein
MRRSPRATLILAIAVPVLAVTLRAWIRPAIALDPPALDLGTVRTRVSRSVVVRNDGWATLQILAVSSSCGCTAAAVDRPSIPPRRTARLTVTFDPIAHGPAAGPARHAIYLRTNDPRTPEAELPVQAVVASDR